MAIKLADTLAPMADFPAAMAEHIQFSDNESLQTKFDNGSLGSGSGGSGEENAIDSISVNGTPLTPDGNKNVDITVPSIEGLATTEYVDNKETPISAEEDNAIIKRDDGLYVSPAKASLLEYINTTKGIEDSPVGHIISHMGNSAPAHYLICDGTEYNIADYPYLTQHFIDEFGSVNYFGGDGTTTFAVPDLRGEFLRGTGTATRNSGSGANVGVHQEPTSIPKVGAKESAILWVNTSEDARTWNMDADKEIYSTTFSGKGKYADRSGTWNDSTGASVAYTTRPTNTSVLYCIKYEPTYFMNLQYNPAVVDFGMINAKLDTSDTRVRTLYEYVNNSLTPVRVKLSDLVAYTNTGGNEGYFTIEVGDVVTQTITLPTDTRTNITIPECVISQGKSLAIKTNWNGTHDGCYWELTGKFIAISDYSEMANGSEVLYTDEEIQEAVATVLGGTA